MEIEQKALKLAREILAQPQFTTRQVCTATDLQKRKNLCFLPKEKARPSKCKDCKYFEGKGGRGWHQTVVDYKTVFHDCLPGKEWLKKHYKDEYPEPTIELSVDGKTLSLNGNFKKGLIKDFIHKEDK